jgi:DNA-binding transcriptional MerR regulator
VALNTIYITLGQDKMARKSGKQAFKMAELVRRTGLKRETIHFYISNGLLPKPPKTERNVAYYDESYVDRIRQIKELQLKYFLPLSVIKEILIQTDAEMSMAEMDLLKVGVSGLIQLQELRRTYEPLTLAELSARTGLPKDEILEMERCEMISSAQSQNKTKVYQEDDIKVVEALVGVRKGGLTKELGFTVDQFRMQSDVISALAIEEVTDFVRKLRGRFPRDAELLGKIAENAIETVNVFICHLRRKKILEVAQALSEGGTNALKQMSSNRSTGKSAKTPGAARQPRSSKTPKRGT